MSNQSTLFFDNWSVTLTVHFGGERPSYPVALFLERHDVAWVVVDGDRVARIRAHDLGHAQAYARALGQNTPSLRFDIEAHYPRAAGGGPDLQA